MRDSSDLSIDSDPTPTTAVVRTRLRWFPIGLGVVLIVAFVVIFSSDMTRDSRVVSSILVGMLGLLLGWLWVAFFYCRRWRSRLLVIVLPVVAMVFLGRSVRPVFDGDMAVIGARLRWWPKADAQLDAANIAGNTGEWTTTEFDFPGFLGPDHDAIIRNVTLDTDWHTHPPKELWRTEVGAGWSGFAVVGNFAVTQEQRGEFEMVVCRRVDNGQIVWTHRDACRFDPADFQSSLGEMGPRATPTIHAGRVFSHGATGIFNCLDASTGELLWTHDTISENGSRVVTWGKSGSPIIVDHMVLVSVGGPNGRSLVAYAIDSGEVAWSAGDRQSSYATPVLTTLGDVRQVVCVNENFVTSHRAEDGEILWEHAWPGDSGANASCPNPIPVDENRILLCKGYGIPSELVQVERLPDGSYATQRQWQKPVMRTKMTNAIIRDGHAYGLDGGILSCIELDTGKKKWKKGRYGHGQVLLVGDLLLVTTELTGEVLVVTATPEKPSVLARQKVLKTDSKMWNYPALAGKYLLIRNAEEAACFELPLVADEGT